VAAAAALACAAAAVVVDTSPSPVAAAADGDPARLATPVLSARRAPGWTTAPVAGRALTAALDPVVAGAPEGTCVGVGDGTRTWYARNPTLPLVPASNLKILTSAAALDVLGAETVLHTRITAPGLPAAGSLPPGGTVEGDLFLVGGGDPLLSSDAWQARSKDGTPPQTDLESVADQVVATGLRRVTGSVVGDASRYDDRRTAESWPQRYLTQGQVAPLSALVANDAWQIDPTTGAGPGGPATDPAAHAAGVLTQLLRARGVQVDGEARSGAAPDAAPVLLDVPSLPVSELVGDVLSFSDNTTTELLVKEMGLATAGEGSTAAGLAAITAWATEEGLPLDGVVLADGSGLSYDNRVTCDLLAAVLRDGGPEGALAAGLSVPGGAGTMQDRMDRDEWPQRLRAKTGSLNTVSSLSGWLASRPGTVWDFQIVENTGEAGAGEAERQFQERILGVLVEHPQAPSLAEAGPLPPTGA
jgi:D-alanyl-D-alanine carboxypeptidase/D-alanyl-D-alanine-endopeptidase (penicillin-binding protein 4)